MYPDQHQQEEIHWSRARFWVGGWWERGGNREGRIWDHKSSELHYATIFSCSEDPTDKCPYVY